jgi:transcriptional regulator with XRE-family HTH domain
MYEEFLPGRIAKLRESKGVSARDMSLSLGQGVNYINMIENKKSFPSMTMFFYICEYLGVTPSCFFENEIDNPAKFNEIMTDLKKLNDTALNHVAGVVREIVNK